MRGDAKAVWYRDEKAIRRLDLGTGKWANAGDWHQILPDPADPGSAYLHNGEHLARYDARTGQVTWLSAISDDSIRGRLQPVLPPGAQIADLTFYRNRLLVATSVGVFRIDGATGRAERLSVPRLTHLPRFEGDGDVYVYDTNTIVRLPG